MEATVITGFFLSGTAVVPRLCQAGWWSTPDPLEGSEGGGIPMTLRRVSALLSWMSLTIALLDNFLLPFFCVLEPQHSSRQISGGQDANKENSETVSMWGLLGRDVGTDFC